MNDCEPGRAPSTTADGGGRRQISTIAGTAATGNAAKRSGGTAGSDGNGGARAEPQNAAINTRSSAASTRSNGQRRTDRRDG